MKIKFFPILMLAIFIFSCNSDEIIEVKDENLLVPIENDSQTLGRGSNETTPCILQQRGCDENYIFPTIQPGGMEYISYFIYYDATLTESEVFCIRHDYFQCHPTLLMSQVQPSDIHLDIWRVPTGKPDDEVTTTVCNDPRVGTQNSCD